MLNKLYLILICLGIILAMFVLQKQIDNIDQLKEKYLNKNVIINNDTLKIIYYNYNIHSFTLENGSSISLSVLEKNIIEEKRK